MNGMDINDILDLVAQDESRTLELKKSTGELKDGMHTACAFLNAEGGWLIFGVTPQSKKIVGQVVTDNTQREIAQALSGIEPAVNVHVEYIDVPDHPGNKVIAMHFEAWTKGEQPYTFNGCPYYKLESTTKVMPRKMYDERVRAYQPEPYAWELQVDDSLSVDDLNENHIRGCIRLGIEGGRVPETAANETIPEILKKWKLLSHGVPNNGAAMLFTKHPGHYGQFGLRLARFRGTTRMEFIDNQYVEGNFFDLLDAGMAFFFKHLSLSGKIVGLMREEHLEVPRTALREALINSLCHRPWEQSNLTNGIAIYDDRIEILNPGELPFPLTPESIKLPHESHPYNRNIANALYQSTYLEKWGTGTLRIIEACREQGVEDPVWELRTGYVVVTFKRPEGGKVGAKTTPKSTKTTPKNYPKTTPKLPQKTTSKKDSNLTNIQRLILKYIAEHPTASKKELAGCIKDLTVDGIKYNLNILKSKGFISHEGPNNGGYWKVNESNES